MRALTISFVLSLLIGATAHAQGPARSQQVPAQVLIVLASNADGGVDARLRDVTALRQPPFDSYRSMELLSSPTIQLRVGEAEQVTLPNGRHVRIVLREITRDGRFRLQVSINRPGQQDYLPEVSVVAAPGDPFFIAGQSYREGTLVIGFRLGQRR